MYFVKGVRGLTKKEIREKLISMQDLKYREFSASLMPTVDPSTVIGVRIPMLRAMARDMLRQAKECGDASDIEEFLSDLPHAFFEENNLHVFIVAGIKSFPECVRRAEEFLPFVDNWSTCDSFRPLCFAKHRTELLPHIYKWIASDREYTVRYAIELLMVYFLDDGFSSKYPDAVSKIRSDKYYVNMMIAWYFATALAKQYDSVIPYLERRILSPWVHNKTIQKACESFRVSKDQKEYLKTLKI